MGLACGAAIIDTRSCLKDPSEAPKRFMIAMADENTEGLHLFMTEEELMKFCMDGIKLTCDGTA